MRFPHHLKNLAPIVSLSRHLRHGWKTNLTLVYIYHLWPTMDLNKIKLHNESSAQAFVHQQVIMLWRMIIACILCFSVCFFICLLFSSLFCLCLFLSVWHVLLRSTSGLKCWDKAMWGKHTFEFLLVCVFGVPLLDPDSRLSFLACKCYHFHAKQNSQQPTSTVYPSRFLYWTSFRSKEPYSGKYCFLIIDGKWDKTIWSRLVNIIISQW